MTNLPFGIGSIHFGRAASISAICRALAARLAWIASTRLRALAAASMVRPFMGTSAVDAVRDRVRAAHAEGLVRGPGPAAR